MGYRTHIYAVSSLFLGMAAASVPLVIFEERLTLKALRPRHMLPFAAGAGAAVVLCLPHFSVATDNFGFTSA